MIIKRFLGGWGSPVEAGRLLAVASVAILLACVISAPAAAQTAAGAVTPYTNASDLRDIASAPDGSMWIASNGGALRFDPVTDAWTVYPKRLGTGPRGNDLVTVAVDQGGRVWVGSATRGFTFYDLATERWDRLSEEWPDPRIRVIRALGAGVYIGTQDGLSLKPIPSRTDICAEASPGCIVPSYVVNDYALVGEVLWVATQDGLGRFNGATWDSANALPDGTEDLESLSLAVLDGVLWEANEAGIRRLVAGTWEDMSFDADRLVVSDGKLYAIGGATVTAWTEQGWVGLAISQDGYSAVRDLEWVGDDLYLATDAGLVRVRPGVDNAILLPPGPPLVEPYAGITVDSQGVVWAGTQQGRIGLVRFDGATWQLFGTADGLDGDWIFTLMSDPLDRIWVGHCCCFDEVSCQLEVRSSDQFQNLSEVRNAWGLDFDSRGRIWAGTEGSGVFVLEHQGDEVWDIALELNQASTGAALASNIIRSVVVTDDGTYMGHLFSGLDYWPHRGNLANGSNGSNWTHTGTQGFGLLDANVGAMAAVGDDVWVGTSSGLHRFRDGVIQSRCPTSIIGVDGDQPRSVSAILGDRRGGLWVGTNNGLLYLRRGAQCTGTGGEFVLLDEDNSALPSATILSAALSPVDGSVWVGTSGGIARIDPDRFAGTDPPEDSYLLYPNPLVLSGSGNLVNLGVEIEGARVLAVPTTEFSRPEVFDLTGRRVAEFDILDGTSWVWDGGNINGDRVVPGLYLVRARRVSGETLVFKLGVVR